MILGKCRQHLQLLSRCPSCLRLAGIGQAQPEILGVLLPAFAELSGFLERGRVSAARRHGIGTVEACGFVLAGAERQAGDGDERGETFVHAGV